MMGKTHVEMGSACWLGAVLAANLMGADVNPLIAGAGVAVAPAFAAGPFSPDADVTWLSFLGHRKATHRPDTTALVLTLITLVAWLALAPQMPFGTDALIWAPVAGWWSHLAGDMIFGGLPISKRIVAKGWIGWRLDTDGLIERGNIRLRSRTASGLHKTKKILPFAPTAVALKGASIVLYVVIVVSWVSASGRGAVT